MRLERTDVCVIGGGPAGSTLATRLAQMGYRVVLVERAAFPRTSVGESLTPGVLALLEMTGAREPVEAAGFRAPGRVSVTWDQGHTWRENADGLLVDRGHFDSILLEQARKAGVVILQPAVVRECLRDSCGWTVEYQLENGTPGRCLARYLADASGRRFLTRGTKRRMGCPTLAVFAYWKAERLPEEPSIEALEEGWLWGVPLPGVIYNTLAFVDPSNVDLRSLLRRSSLFAGDRGWQRVSPIHNIDATPYLDVECVNELLIRTGDAASSLDPLSSSGVQKAIRMSLAAAVVVNTIMRRPESTPSAIDYYRTTLREDAEKHARWADSLYSALPFHTPFWQRRRTQYSSAVPTVETLPVSWERRYAVSQQTHLTTVPCLVGDFVEARGALHHPNLDRPLAFLHGHCAPWLFEQMTNRVATLREIAAMWTNRVPIRSGVAMAHWMAEKGLLRPVDSSQAAS